MHAGLQHYENCDPHNEQPIRSEHQARSHTVCSMFMQHATFSCSMHVRPRHTCLVAGSSQRSEVGSSPHRPSLNRHLRACLPLHLHSTCLVFLLLHTLSSTTPCSAAERLMLHMSTICACKREHSFTCKQLCHCIRKCMCLHVFFSVVVPGCVSRRVAAPLPNHSQLFWSLHCIVNVFFTCTCRHVLPNQRSFAIAYASECLHVSFTCTCTSSTWAAGPSQVNTSRVRSALGNDITTGH